MCIGINGKKIRDHERGREERKEGRGKKGGGS